MAPMKRQSRGPGPRPHGLLFAEVALVVVLLAALGFSWPASAPTSPPNAATPPISSLSAALKASGELPPGEDLSRNRLRPVPPPPAGWPNPLLFPPAASASPVQLFIASLNLHPLVESVAVERSGAMSPPYNYFDVGWYKLGPVPGDPGDAVIDGHAGYPDQPLVFGKLSKLRLDDKIVVVLADGSRRTFLVDSVKSWPWTAHPTGLFQPDGPARLTLITCSGKFNDKTYAYADRLVVEARYDPGA
jgi:sortase family protein